ncbi:MAG: nucleoside hydrolase [Clostridia bacterium]|nr:nucleoside hydrolase [Clostridia bacterium]
METKKKILIDTDIGGDVDDALALAMALNTPSIEIVGITNVYLANAWRAGVTKKLLNTYGRDDIPVCTGAEKPLIGWWDENRIPPSSPDYGEYKGEKMPHAADYIIHAVETIEDLIIVAIGPLTNLGIALAKAPHIASKLNIIMMGGQVTKAHPEWNIVCDPEAARIVFESGAKITMIGLDVTNRCQFSQADIDYVKNAGNVRAETLAEMMEIFKKNFGYMPILHDPLAMSVLIWDDILTFENKKILIETSGQNTRGLTIDCDWGAGNDVLVATDVKVDEFKKRVLELLIK